jgi:hypothetical protein
MEAPNVWLLSSSIRRLAKFNVFSDAENGSPMVLKLSVSSVHPRKGPVYPELMLFIGLAVKR